MTDIRDKATASPDVDLARQSAPGVYRMLSEELTAADDLTPEGQFPKYGDFLEVETTTGGSDPAWNRTRYIECPEALAEWLVENIEDAKELGFRIVSVKKVDGRWQYDVDVLDADEAPADSADE